MIRTMKRKISNKQQVLKDRPERFSIETGRLARRMMEQSMQEIISEQMKSLIISVEGNKCLLDMLINGQWQGLSKPGHRKERKKKNWEYSSSTILSMPNQM